MNMRITIFTFIILITSTLVNITQNVNAMKLEPEELNNKTCPVCTVKKKPKQYTRLACTHILCKSCLTRLYANEQINVTPATCPLCRDPIFTNNELLIAVVENHPTYKDALQAARESKQVEETRTLVELFRLAEEDRLPLCSCSSPEQPKIAGRELPCGHTFCTHCLRKVHARSVVHQQPSCCPTCQDPMFEDPLEKSRLKMILEGNRRKFNELLRRERLCLHH